jgi:hypothetical protein
MAEEEPPTCDESRDKKVRPITGAEYAVAFKSDVSRVRPLPCLPPYARCLDNSRPSFWFQRAVGAMSNIPMVRARGVPSEPAR